MQRVEATPLATAATWEKNGVARGAGQESIGAVEETFLERMVLIVLDLTTGYIVREETADDRRYAIWKARVDARRDALRAQVRSVVSDRAKALIPRADKGLGCRSRPDFFPLLPDIVPSSSLALGQRLKQARQECQQAADRLRRHPEGDARGAASREATPQVAVHHAAVTSWEARHQEYRQPLATLSRPLHPCAIDDAAPQTSAQGAARLHAHVEAIAALAHAAPLPERAATMTKGKKPWPAVATLSDFWWQGVRQDCEHAAVSPPWQRWAQEV